MVGDCKNIKDIISYSEGGILSKELLKNKNSGLTLFCMAEGTEISEHTSKKKAFIYVIEGKGIFNLEGKKIEMLPGVIILMEENKPHSLRVEQKTSFILCLFG